MEDYKGLFFLLDFIEPILSTRFMITLVTSTIWLVNQDLIW